MDKKYKHEVIVGKTGTAMCESFIKPAVMNLNNLEQYFNYILQYANFNFYNVGKAMIIQLFDKKYCANDEIGCIAEFDGKTIESALLKAIDWINGYLA